MRNGRLLFSAVEFLFITALFLVGAVFFAFHFLPHARSAFAQWILDAEDIFFLMGCLVAAGALILGICFTLMQKGSFIRMKGRGFSIDEALICSMIQEFWKEEFPEKELPLEIYCAKNRIEIISSPLKEDLEEIEGRLGFFLAKHLGYEKEFYLSFIEK